MTNALRALALATALAATVGTTAAAQTGTTTPRSTTTGLGVGVFASGSLVASDVSEKRETGAGLGLHVGYGLTETLSVFGRASRFVAETSTPGWDGRDYSVNELAVGVRASWGTRAFTARPFAQFMVGRRNLKADLGDIGNLGTVEGDGIAVSAGAGVEWFLNPELAVEASLSVSQGSLDATGGRGGYIVGYDIDATITRLDIGVSLRP